MKKLNIIKKSTDFERIIKNNKSTKSKYLYIYIDKHDETIYRFGLSVGKKVGNAVTRNKIKRQLKEIISQNDYQNNFDCIIIVRKEIVNHTFSEIKEDVNDIFNKLSIKRRKNEK